ncbi:hypothetical protein L2E82_43583 [Cichorium intybus]|uniref:Uncharacterized protein n=1 Tax=Cichorium intybus TaxID=13427 RepID=A0ACB8ZMW0_CICIN|nr:hypothetical protein L2E82_43583 [Cichorium intybus]
MDILVENRLDPGSEEYRFIRYNILYGGNFMRCEEWCRLPVITPCRHLLCLEYVALNNEKCTFPGCENLYEMQSPETFVPKDLIELQPSYKQLMIAGIKFVGMYSPMQPKYSKGKPGNEELNAIVVSCYPIYNRTMRDRKPSANLSCWRRCHLVSYVYSSPAPPPLSTTKKITHHYFHHVLSGLFSLSFYSRLLVRPPTSTTASVSIRRHVLSPPLRLQDPFLHRRHLRRRHLFQNLGHLPPPHSLPGHAYTKLDFPNTPNASLIVSFSLSRRPKLPSLS